MSRSTILVPAAPEQVFAVLDDAAAYPRWVLGARRVRSVDPEWPAVGARFHHALGAAGTELRDSTKILDRRPPRRLRLEVRFRPLGVAEVELGLRAADGGTRVDLEEHPTAGLVARLPRVAVDPLLALRNARSLRRLRDEVIRRVSQSPAGAPLPSAAAVSGPKEGTCRGTTRS